MSDNFIRYFNKFMDNCMLPKINPFIACSIAVVSGILLESLIGTWAIIPTFYLLLWYFECTEN
jgi:hypothetical protein